MLIDNDVVGCDFCERTSADQGNVIYECDECSADCCSVHSVGPFGPHQLVYCDPAPESGTEGCANDIDVQDGH